MTCGLGPLREDTSTPFWFSDPPQLIGGFMHNTIRQTSYLHNNVIPQNFTFSSQAMPGRRLVHQGTYSYGHVIFRPLLMATVSRESWAKSVFPDECLSSTLSPTHHVGSPGPQQSCWRREGRVGAQQAACSHTPSPQGLWTVSSIRCPNISLPTVPP